MRPLHTALITAAALAAAGFAIADSAPQPQQDPSRHDIDGGARAQAKDRAARSALKSALLVVHIDARGAEVIQLCKKPDLDYIAPKSAQDKPFGWTLRDASGNALATGSFDPGPVDLAAGNFGRPPRAIGADRLIQHEVVSVVKIPDLDAWTTIEFSHRRQGRAPRALGAPLHRTNINQR